MNVENCAWTSVLREILRLTILFPYSITSGLCLLTELLPIPLPLTVRQVLTFEREFFAYDQMYLLAIDRKRNKRS